MRPNQIKNLVHDLVKKYETRNPYQLADSLGVIIQIGDLGELMREAVVAHELAHCVLHDGDYYFFSYGEQFYSNKVEIEAHTFAAELLIPDETIIEHPGYTLDQLSSLTGYAERLVSFKRL